MRAVGQIQPDQPSDLFDGQISARNPLAADFVAGEQVRFQVAAAAGLRQNVFEGDHVDPDRVLAAAARSRNVAVEAVEELPVELSELQIIAPVSSPDVTFEVVADAPIFIKGGFAAVDAHHAAELLVVATEKSEQLFPVLFPTEKRFFTAFGVRCCAWSSSDS